VQLYAGPRPKVSVNAFEDLLGGHSFSGKKEPKTMKELRQYMDVRDMDPEQRKVNTVPSDNIVEYLVNLVVLAHKYRPELLKHTLHVVSDVTLKTKC